MTRPSLRRRRPRFPLNIVSWNAKVGRRPARVARGLRVIIRDVDPDVIVLQEAMQYVAHLRLTFLTLWRTISPPDDWREARNCPVMVRRWRKPVHRTQGVGWGWLRNTVTWIGPKHGIVHPGRTWTWVKVSGVYVVSLHRVYGGGTRNREAYAEEFATLARFITARRHVVVIGDTNTPFGSHWAHSMDELADTTGSVLVADPDRPGIDYALLKGCTGTLRRLPYAEESDHRPVVLTVTGLADTA